MPALAEIRDLDTLNAELGFSDPPAGAGDASDGPGLTVVGGTEPTDELLELLADWLLELVDDEERKP